MQNQKMPYLILDAAFFAAFPSVLYVFPSTPLSGKPAADSRRQDKFFRTAQIRSSPEPSASPGYPHVYQFAGSDTAMPPIKNRTLQIPFPFRNWLHGG